MRRATVPLLVTLGAAPLFLGYDCGGGALSIHDPSAQAATWTNALGTVSVEVLPSPFRIVVHDKTGAILLESADLPLAPDAADQMRAYGAGSFSHVTDQSVRPVYYGWDYFRGDPGPWSQAARVERVETSPDRLIAHVVTSDPAHPTATLTVSSQGIGARLVFAVDNAGVGAPDLDVNRVSLAFKMHDDDHFFGFGERFVRSDHRGQVLYNWTEDGGFGRGESVLPGPDNPYPGGEGQTNMPIPWFLSPRGFGALLNTSFRTVYHLGDDTPAAFRVEAWTTKLDFTVFADPDPLALLEALTEVTGRPPAVPDWALAPRRRADLGAVEGTRLRLAHVPTTMLDTALHYFPDGVGAELEKPGALKVFTDDMHRRGFKAIAYFSPFVADSYHPVFDDAVSRGYLVKHPDGTPYIVINPPFTIGMVDFTNKDAVAWYQTFLQRALDDGWDGWMYDFGEYLPTDAVLSNGMTGAEAHNVYPVLYQRAAFELLERERKGDYLFFVRSGFTGTAGVVPMVWAGDQSTDFDLADGLPAALVGALNVGMSGIPLWGTDISGYFFIDNPAPDKEVYLRWTELAAFTADMHDENVGTGKTDTSTRWQIWSDAETTAVYAKYASYKTRMGPYLKDAVRAAQRRGVPVMRHLYLSYPKDARVFDIADEYMYGDALLVAPVLGRGQTSRKVYLPEPAYFDFFSGARVVGGDIVAEAPLDTIPVYAKVGAIVPMLAADVETLVPAPDGSVISSADRVGMYEVQVFAGGQSQFALDDGTVISQSAPLQAFTPDPPSIATGAVPVVSSAKDLTSCDSCAFLDPASHTLEIAVRTRDLDLVAGALRLAVRASPDVKRFVFVVHH